jgi:hypothetical protein
MTTGLVVLLAALALPVAAQNGDFSREQIEQMVAPIALYPDALLSQILMAASYPSEIVRAARWVRANGALKGAALDSALSEQSWDASVLSLCQTPEVLKTMSQNLDWTEDLGNAFLDQPSDVMDAVQRLRSEARKAGNLSTNAQMKVVQESSTIIIQPADPQIIYVPTYNPQIVYGPAWNYPTHYYASVWPSFGRSLVNGFAWGAGMAIGRSLFGGCDWRHRNVYINNNVFVNNNIYRNTNYYRNGNFKGRGNWSHNPQHRGNVRYRNERVAQKYNRPTSAGARRDAMRGYNPPGRPGQGGAKPGHNARPAQGQNRPGAVAKPSQPGGASVKRPTGDKQSSFAGSDNGRRDRAASNRGAHSRNKPGSGMSRPAAGGKGAGSKTRGGAAKGGQGSGGKKR